METYENLFFLSEDSKGDFIFLSQHSKKQFSRAWQQT